VASGLLGGDIRGTPIQLWHQAFWAGYKYVYSYTVNWGQFLDEAALKNTNENLSPRYHTI
jgi:hypothetical protein